MAKKSNTKRTKQQSTNKKTSAKKSANTKQSTAENVPRQETWGESGGHPPSRQASRGGEKSKIVVDFPIVGIGSSAGGLRAMEEFFGAMPADSGLAFIVVAHLKPDHASLLDQLLQKKTDMPVVQIEDGMNVEANHVYVIPPNKELAIMNRKLQLFDLPAHRGGNMPIDDFFRTLAKDLGSRAICIILSGLGSDGTLGLKAIKGELGMVMVQDEASAKFNGMPRSAIATNLADYILPADEMPNQLLKYSRHMWHEAPVKMIPADEKMPGEIQKILQILRAKTKHDFSFYKKNTITRRIARRMSVHQIKEFADYITFIQDYEEEVEKLFKELLIGVTQFFRDEEAFDTLEKKFLPKLIQQKKQSSQSFRVWAPGCSTGEEAYSLAILIDELIEREQVSLDVQIFGTDIDEEAVNAAREGVYPPSIASDVKEERLERYFHEQDDGKFKVKKKIREMLVFASHNITKDPPFTKLDLLSCRNLLIYLDAEMQNKLVPIFHYSLRNTGLLFLGSSETIGKHGKMFKPVNKKWKIYQRIPAENHEHLSRFFPSAAAPEKVKQPDISESMRKADELSALQYVQTILRQSSTPPCALIDEANNILFIHGRLDTFLQPPEGKISINIVDMAHDDLKRDLLTAIRHARQSKQEQVQENIRLDTRETHVKLTLRVTPIFDQNHIKGLAMVVFKETTEPEKGKEKPQKDGKKSKSGKSPDELEKELQNTKEDLQTTIEELETSNEELKSTNEELQSTNEELQSANEELETSKEELQSLNEEAETTNSALESRIEQLSKSNNDLKNLLNSTDIATIFLDTRYCIRRYTPRSKDILPLEEGDLGRPIDHFALQLQSSVELRQKAEKVLKDLSTIEEEVEGKNGATYLMCLRPYRTVNNVIDGVVLTFQDITAMKELERQKLKVKDRILSFCQGIVNTVQESLLLLDDRFYVIFANEAFYTLFSTKQEETVGEKVFNLGNGQWDIKELRQLLENLLEKQAVIENYVVEHEFEDLGQRVMLLNGRKLKIEESKENILLLAIMDITNDPKYRKKNGI